ncbi:MAG: c-type cytochrome [Verrucomicrobiales bacterium]|nr:c-type cytochrome [Verrucomicrobiales bacterium]
MNRFLIIVLCIVVSPPLRADPGAEISVLSKDVMAVKQGETIYKQMCFACHGMNLEGAAGPNLMDATWIHGATPADWFRVITEGVSEKGMMAYEAVYDETTRKNLAAYLLSKQEGLRSFQYEIYPPVSGESEALPGFGSGEPIKSGEISDALVDLSPAEMQEFSMVFKGRFLVPRDGKYIFIHHTRDGRFRMKLNGLVSKSEGGNKKRTRLVVDLKAGEYEMEVAYQRTDGTPHLLLFDVLVPSGINFPLSRDSHQILTTSTHIYEVADQARVVRTVLDGIPHETLAVGLTGGLSFTVGRDASIYSIWDGLFLDTGPNVSERGKRAAQTGPPWFATADGIRLLVDGNPADLRLKEYRMESSQSPVFEFVDPDGGKLTLSAESSDPEALNLLFSIEGIKGELELSIPAGVFFDNELLSQSSRVPIKDPSNFPLTIPKP